MNDVFQRVLVLGLCSGAIYACDSSPTRSSGATADIVTTGTAGGTATDATDATDATSVTDGARTTGADATDSTTAGTTATDGVDGTNGSDGTDGASGASDASDLQLPTYTEGECPAWTGGKKNSVQAAGHSRFFQLFLPSEPQGAPLLIMWHGLGDTSTNFSSAWGADQIAQLLGAIVIVPSVLPSAGGGGILPPMWTFPNTLVGADDSKDLAFFDNLLACANANYGIDTNRIYSLGFSSGALWTTYLTLKRSQYFAAVAIFSGGVNAQVTFPYEKPSHPIKALLAHGGASDIYAGGLLKFYEMVKNYADALVKDGHFAVMCDHGMGHKVTGPVINAAVSFLKTHTRADSQSPLKDTGLPAAYPSICSIQ